MADETSETGQADQSQRLADVGIHDIGQRLIDLGEQLVSVGQLTDSNKLREGINQAQEIDVDEVWDGVSRDMQAAIRRTLSGLGNFRREYGDWEFGGNDDNTSRTTRGDGQEAMLQTVRNKQSELSSFTAPGYFGSGTLAGLATWSAFDYNRGANATTCHSGLLDLFRVPKFAFWFYRSQRDPRVTQDGVSDGPLLYVANWWQPPADAGPITVVVFANCDEVELIRNGRTVARQRPDSGGINVRVPHPPFTFSIDYEPGELRAIGYLAGRRVRSATVRTPGPARSLRLDVDLPGGRLVADGVDFAVVRASVLDAHGTLVPDNAHRVTFAARGAGRIIGDASIGANPVTATAGVATALVRAGRHPGRIALTATASGLATATHTVRSTPDHTPRL